MIPAAPQRSSIVRTAVLLLATIALLAASGFVGTRLLFATFRLWDDEGYMLLIVRELVRGGGLYDRIQTPYAPLFFETVAGLHLGVGLALDNVSARWIALVIWLGASLGCAALVYRATRSAFFALVAYALVFPLLMALNGEPMHPSQGIVLLLPFLAIAALDSGTRQSSTVRSVITGALAAAVLCIKLNVGTYVLLAFAGGFLRRAGPLGRIGLLLLAAFPIALMASLFEKPWARDLALLETASIGCLAAVPWFVATSDRSSRRELLSFVAGALLTGLVVLGIAFATGTTLGGLWNGLVLETVRVPSVFFTVPNLPSLGLVIPPLLLLPVVAALHRRGSPRAILAIAVLKCAAAVVVLVVDLSAHRCLGALPWLWLFAVPTGREAKDRWQLAFLAVAVSLQVYPVAGSQMSFSAFLFPPIALVALHDVVRGFAGWKRALVPVGAAVLFAFHPFYRLLPEWLEADRRFVPLGLPGAESIRLQEPVVAIQRWLAANLRANSATFFGMPGLDSLYIWTGMEPPVPFYSHMWMVQTPIERQKEIAALLAERRDVCVVRNREILETWLQGRPLAASPIVDAIERGYQVAARTGGYEILLPIGRTPDLVLSARRAAIPTTIARTPEDRFALQLSFPAMPGVRVARIAVYEPESDRILFDTRSDDLGAVLLAADTKGHDLEMPFPLDQRTDVLLLCPAGIARYHPDRILVRAYDESGAVAARLPLVR